MSTSNAAVEANANPEMEVAPAGEVSQFVLEKIT